MEREAQQEEEQQQQWQQQQQQQQQQQYYGSSGSASEGEQQAFNGSSDNSGGQSASHGLNIRSTLPPTLAATPHDNAPPLRTLHLAIVLQLTPAARWAW